MKHLSLAALGGVTALGLASFLLPRDAVSFAPGSETRFSKTFEGLFEYSLDEMRVTINGEEQDDPLDEDVAGNAAWTIAITDTFQAVDQGRPTTLLRRFDEISVSMESSGGDSEEGSMDELQGKTVRFEWDDEEGIYDVTFEDGDGEEDALRLLTPDMDYRTLLPRGEVSKGDDWEIGGADLLRILVPGLDLKNAAESGIEIDGERVPQAMVDLLDEFLEGVSATCTYLGSSQVDGVEVGEIGIKGEISGTTTIDPRELSDEDIGFDGDIDVIVTIKLPVEGTLLWNLKGGHFQSFLLEGEGTVDVEMTMTIPDFGMDVKNEVSASILLEQRATAEKAAN